MAVILARGAASSPTSSYLPQYAVTHFVLLTVFSGLATIAVALRFWARKIKNQGFWLSDFLTVLGLVFALAETFVNIYACCYPVKREIGDMSEETGLQLLFLSPILWMTAVTTIRAAIIFLYVQLFPNRSFTIICYTVLAINILFGVSGVIADCLICRPITYRWTPDMVGGSCGDQKLLDMYIAVLNVLHDVMLVALPMPILWGLKVQREKKVALTCMFGIGILVCAITIYRVEATSTIGDPTDLHAQDTYCDIALLTSLEALIGIICACLPFLRPLVHKFQDSLPKRGTNTKSLSSSGGVPIATRAPRLPYIKQYFNGLTSMTDSTWCQKEAQKQHEKQGSV